MLRLRKLLWNDANTDHLWASHHVQPSEVDELVFGYDDQDSDYIVQRDGDNYIVYGQTAGGRLLYVALQPLGEGWFRPFAARDMTPPEIRAFRKRRR